MKGRGCLSGGKCGWQLSKVAKLLDKNVALERADVAKSVNDKVNEELEFLNKKLIKHISQKK